MQVPAEQDLELDNLTVCSSLISASLIASLIVAQRGWVMDKRTYPHLPILDNLSIAQTFEPLLYGVMVIALLTFNFNSRKMLLALIFAIAALATIALDQTRLQPWLYLFSIMLLLTASLKYDNSSKACSSVLNALRICLMGTYLFAGVQKLNISFCQIVVPSMMSKVIPAMPSELGCALGIPLAIVEAGLGILLAFPYTCKVGAYLAIFFHAVTLWLITQQNWNAVVWPWNISMMVLVYLLFIRSKPASALSLLKPDSLQKIIAMLLFLALPVLNFYGLWDNYLSSALYSGNVPVLRIQVNEEDEALLPSSIRQAVDISDKNAHTLIVERWALDELGIPAYPEVPSLEKLAEKIVQSGRFSRSRIYIETYPRFFKGEKCRRQVFLSAAESR